MNWLVKFQLGYVHYPILMILIDFLPGILTLGFVLAYKNECHPLLALGIVAHPLLLPGISVAEYLDKDRLLLKLFFCKSVILLKVEFLFRKQNIATYCEPYWERSLCSQRNSYPSGM